MGLFSFFKKSTPVEQAVQQVVEVSKPKRKEPHMNFTTREEYFAYKEDWKNRYFSTIQEIRTAALARREAERAFSAFERANASREVPYKELYAELSKAHRAKSTHIDLKEKAGVLLSERWASKIRAAEQREKRLAELKVI